MANQPRRQKAIPNEIYDRFAKQLEAEHMGEFVAISKDGAVVVSRDDVEVVRKAIEMFGSGNFVLRRIGH